MQPVGLVQAPAALPDDPATQQAILRAALAEIERLQFQPAGLRRHRFGRRSAKLADETVLQATEGLEQSVAEKMAGLAAAARAKTRPSAGEPPKRNRGALPAHLPLYRQSQIFARHGIELDRSTLCNWVGRACWWLAPLHELMLSTVLSSPKVFADDTTLPVLDPGNGRTKTGRLCCYAVDNRPWQGPGHPVAAHVYSEDRTAAHPANHLKGFHGLLQVDGYVGFGSLVKAATDSGLQPAFCWAHTRRRFYDAHEATKSPLAGEALRRIAALDAIEADIRGQTADERRAIRQERSRPLVEAMHAWLTETLGRIPGRSTLAQAIRYALNHWSGLILFLDDGRLELDTNTVERALRPVAPGRKNPLFAGADSGGEHWALVATLIQTAKLNKRDPLAWLTEVLERIVSGQTKRNALPTLLPWNWKPVPTTSSSA